MLRFHAWNWFRFQILIFFKKIVIPILILVPTVAGMDFTVESVPGLELVPIQLEASETGVFALDHENRNIRYFWVVQKFKVLVFCSGQFGLLPAMA